MFIIIFVIILFVTVAFNFNRGLWKNMVTLINVIFAGLLATNYFEPVAEMAKGWNITFDYVWDVLAAWLLFAGSMFLLRVFTDRLTVEKVRFIKPVDLGGGVFFSLWSGWILACFACMTFHLAPIPRDSVEASPATSSLPLSADRTWLGFMQGQSYGALGQAASDKDNDYIFDAQGDFILRYGASRKKLEELKAASPDPSVFRFPKGREGT